MSDRSESRFGRPRPTTILAFVGGAAVAMVLLPAGITAATSQPPLNILISDPDDNSRQAKVDAGGALKVSSSGTSTVSGSVTVANTPLPVSGTVEVQTPPATKFFAENFVADFAHIVTGEFGRSIDMSLITFPSGNDDELRAEFYLGDSFRFSIGDNESLPKFVALTQPIRADNVRITCLNEFQDCRFGVRVVGS